MKSIRSLRLLSLLGFLLLVAPFYDQCSKKEVASEEEIMIDTTAVEMPVMKNDSLIVEDNTVKDSIIDVERKEPSFYQRGYEFIDDRNNSNAFEFAYFSIEYLKIPFTEIKKELSEDFNKRNYGGLSLLITCFCFLLIVLISFSNFILSLFKRVKWINKLAIINSILLLITVICILFFDPFFKTYEQIKWGYYAFTLVQIGIYYSSKLQSIHSKI